VVSSTTTGAFHGLLVGIDNGRPSKRCDLRFVSASHERRIALSRRPRVGVVGGGISGLAVAYYLQEEGAAAGLEPDVTLLERSPRLGGVIETMRQEGLLLEAGPDAFAPGSQVLSLIDALQLSDQLLALQPGGRGTFIYNGRTL